MKVRTRRDFLTSCATSATLAATSSPAASTSTVAHSRPKIAAITTIYTHNSHADLIVGRLVETDTLDNKGPRPPLDLVSVYADQQPERDKSKHLASTHGFRLSATIADALTLGSDRLAVDGVLLIGEHGQYPTSPTGQTMYPRRRFFEETVAVFRKSGRVVPVFCDKHLAWNWADSKWMYDTGRELSIPFMAGSSLPVTWRRPPIELTEGTPLTEAVAISYHTLDHYGFHALEMLQCLAERRRDGEVGIAAVQCLEGAAVWQARDAGRFSAQLFDAALARREHTNRFQGRIEDAVQTPVAFLLEYRDGFRAAVLTLNYANDEWCIAWRGHGEPQSTLFWTQEARPFGHFGFQLAGFEAMVRTGKPTWPVERTLLTSGALDKLLVSRLHGGTRIETPELAIAYKPTFTWREPPDPPPGRPLDGQ